MSDRLEDFIRQNREQFDVHEPDPSLWLKINPANKTKEKKPGPARWLRIAATIAMIFAGSTAGIYFLSGNRAETDQFSQELIGEMAETEHYYRQVVNERMEELQPYLADDPVAGEMLKMDLEELDEAYLELKDDLKDQVSNPEVVEAMILNYTIKLEILEDLLLQIKEKETQDENYDTYAL